MATIDDIIGRESNPFDPVTYKTGNFWQEDDARATPLVASIHQAAIDQMSQMLEQVAHDHRTRSILLLGDPGSGKSYVLKRLKEQLNAQAFFAYIPPMVDNDYMWRHVLRYTVDSLMHVPVGKTESQLLLWLKNLSVFQQQGLMQRLIGERRSFINQFQSAYPVGIHQSKDFFGVLHALTDPALYPIACNWLRGEDLDDEDLQSLKVRKSIDNEVAAQGILSNLGRISTSTYPIVLCFDQVESKRLPDGSADIAPTFMINTTFHNENFKNFLVIISIAMNNWQWNKLQVQQSDRARIEQEVLLKPISLVQAKALWEVRLKPLHQQVDPKPASKLYPLRPEVLEQKHPGGKTTPRNALSLGNDLFLGYKKTLHNEPNPSNQDLSNQDQTAAFKLLWERELQKTEQKVSRMQYFSAPELIAMLSRVLAALRVPDIRLKWLPSSTYGSYSLAYSDAKRHHRIGLVWTEDANMTTFCNVMKACQKMDSQHLYQALYLIRAASPGRTNNKGYAVYQQVFVQSQHNRHFKPDLASIHYLATYDRLVNSVHAQELVLGESTVTLSHLEALVRQTEVLRGCCLLQTLKLVSSLEPDSREPQQDQKRHEKVEAQKRDQRAKDYLLNFVQTQHLISRQVAQRQTCDQFPDLPVSKFDQLLQDLVKTNQVNILDPSAPPNQQLICLIPQGQPSC